LSKIPNEEPVITASKMDGWDLTKRPTSPTRAGVMNDSVRDC
jgi:hypothetical protein